jgi:hypothetical protein
MFSSSLPIGASRSKFCIDRCNGQTKARFLHFFGRIESEKDKNTTKTTRMREERSAESTPSAANVTSRTAVGTKRAADNINETASSCLKFALFGLVFGLELTAYDTACGYQNPIANA